MRIRHFGYIIQKDDFEDLLKFYKVLGFRKLYDQVEDWSGVFIFGKERIVKIQNDYGEIIELILSSGQFAGCHHIALTTDNLNKLCKKIEKNNYIILVEPFISKYDSNIKLAFIQAPGGSVVELVEEINSD